MFVGTVIHEPCLVNTIPCYSQLYFNSRTKLNSGPNNHSGNQSLHFFHTFSLTSEFATEEQRAVGHWNVVISCQWKRPGNRRPQLAPFTASARHYQVTLTIKYPVIVPRKLPDSSLEISDKDSTSYIEIFQLWRVSFQKKLYNLGFESNNSMNPGRFSEFQPNSDDLNPLFTGANNNILLHTLK